MGIASSKPCAGLQCGEIHAPQFGAPSSVLDIRPSTYLTYAIKVPDTYQTYIGNRLLCQSGAACITSELLAHEHGNYSDLGL